MSYEKNTWKTGDVITAALLNHMEEGIEAKAEKGDKGDKGAKGDKGDPGADADLTEVNARLDALEAKVKALEEKEG